MIRNESLSERLNKFKNNQSTEESPTVEEKIQEDHKVSIYDSIITLSLASVEIFKIFSYGYASKIVFNTSWKFWEAMCVGLAITFLLNFISKLIHK